MENKITFRSGQLSLEGMFNPLSAATGAVITHPHPLYGGDMANPVVESLVRSFNRKNISTLRFNFRGVRGSEGVHDGGSGEQEDTLAAVRFLLEQGMDSVLIAGYSFGSWVVANIADLPRGHHSHPGLPAACDAPFGGEHHPAEAAARYHR